MSLAESLISSILLSSFFTHEIAQASGQGQVGRSTSTSRSTHLGTFTQIFELDHSCKPTRFHESNKDIYYLHQYENQFQKLDFKQKLNTFDEISPSKSTSESDDSQAGFLVSFIVDARGGVMTSQRRPELRFIIPENTCPSPTRITCRLARYNKPPLSEGESQASRVLEVTPHSMHFNRYVTFVLRIAHQRHPVVKMS